MEAPKPSFHKHLYLIPYSILGSSSEVNVGRVKFWNPHGLLEKYVLDLELKEKIEEILRIHKDGTRLLSSQAIVSVGDVDFRELNLDEYKEMLEARLIFFLSFLARNNTIEKGVNSGHWMATAENFDVNHFSVLQESSMLTEYSGFIVNKINGGLSLDTYTQQKPSYILGPTGNSLDENFILELVNLKKQHSKTYAQILSAAQVFYESYFNVSDVSMNARVLLQTSAFEILLGAGSGTGRISLINFIKVHIDLSEDRKYTYVYKAKSGTNTSKGTIKEIWADRFFTLRNGITHGLSPKPADFIFKWKHFKTEQRHIDIALWFFILCVKNKIENVLKRVIFDDEIKWESWEDDLEIPSKKYSGFVYEYHHGFGRRSWGQG